MDVHLVADVEDDAIRRKIEHTVQGQRQFDDTQVGCEVAAVFRADRNEHVPNLLSDFIDFGPAEFFYVGGSIDTLNHHIGQHPFDIPRMQVPRFPARFTRAGREAEAAMNGGANGKSMIETKTFFTEANAALVLIDLQRGITGRQVAPHPADVVVKNASRLVEAFRASGLPIVFVRVSPSAQTRLRPLVDNPPNMPAPPRGWDELDPALGARADDVVVTKQNWGAFYGTDLDLQLRRRDVTRIAICGISTNIGVESTARDAYERNYKLLFIEDAMAAMSAQEHEHSCAVIFPRMGIIRSTVQAVQALTA